MLLRFVANRYPRHTRTRAHTHTHTSTDERIQQPRGSASEERPGGDLDGARFVHIVNKLVWPHG